MRWQTMNALISCTDADNQYSQYNTVNTVKIAILFKYSRYAK